MSGIGLKEVRARLLITISGSGLDELLLRSLRSDGNFLYGVHVQTIEAWSVRDLGKILDYLPGADKYREQLIGFARQSYRLSDAASMQFDWRLFQMGARGHIRFGQSQEGMMGLFNSGKELDRLLFGATPEEMARVKDLTLKLDEEYKVPLWPF